MNPTEFSRQIQLFDKHIYNVQSVVDHKHKLVVEHEVTNEVADQGQLSTMSKR